VRFSTPAKVALALALTTTLGLKAAWTRDSPRPDARLFADHALRFLQQAGFGTRQEKRRFGIISYGRKGECLVMLAEYRPHGINAVPLAAHARPLGPLRYAWRGALTDLAPKLVPLSEFYLDRELRRAGFQANRHPIVAVAGNENCHLAALPWHQLAAVPR
jgi:hypothetical protein